MVARRQRNVKLGSGIFKSEYRRRVSFGRLGVVDLFRRAAPMYGTIIEPLDGTSGYFNCFVHHFKYVFKKIS